MAFVGKPEDRYHAEKTFSKAPDVDKIMRFDTYREFFTEVKRENHSLHTAVICITECDFPTLKQEILAIESKATVFQYTPICV